MNIFKRIWCALTNRCVCGEPVQHQYVSSPPLEVSPTESWLREGFVGVSSTELSKGEDDAV